MFCLPILKREEHRQAVLAAAVSGNPRFFLGTDSAPHPRGEKVHVHIDGTQLRAHELS